MADETAPAGTGSIRERVERNAEDLSDRLAECIRLRNSADACSWSQTLQVVATTLGDLRAQEAAEES